MIENKEIEDVKYIILQQGKDYVPLTEKALLNIKEIMVYTGWGENKVRDMLNHPRCPFVVRNGNRLFAYRKSLDRYLESRIGKI